MSVIPNGQFARKCADNVIFICANRKKRMIWLNLVRTLYEQFMCVDTLHEIIGTIIRVLQNIDANIKHMQE